MNKPKQHHARNGYRLAAPNRRGRPIQNADRQTEAARELTYLAVDPAGPYPVAVDPARVLSIVESFRTAANGQLIPVAVIRIWPGRQKFIVSDFGRHVGREIDAAAALVEMESERSNGR